MSDDISISRSFILEEIAKAPPLYLSVYLMTKALGDVDAATIARKLDILESDVVRGWQYWQGRASVNAQGQTPKGGIVLEEKPDYSMEELAEYMKNDHMKRLLQTAQKKLGKPLTQQDIRLIFGFHDWLGLPIEVIEMLFSYCVSDGFKGMRYVEKVAMGWAEEGIDSLEKAGQYIEMRKSGYSAIMGAFGQRSRTPAPAEEDYMKKWLGAYAFPIDVIQLACQRTILQTGKVSFPYADSILTKWKESGVKNVGDVETLDRAFTAKKAINNSAATGGGDGKTPPKPKQNKFINYTQREWDFDKLEALEEEERKKW